LVQAFLKKWWVESDFKAPNLPLSESEQQDETRNVTEYDNEKAAVTHTRNLHATPVLFYCYFFGRELS
jgi:hypothetical protein